MDNPSFLFSISFSLVLSVQLGHERSLYLTPSERGSFVNRWSRLIDTENQAQFLGTKN